MRPRPRTATTRPRPSGPARVSFASIVLLALVSLVAPAGADGELLDSGRPPAVVAHHAGARELPSERAQGEVRVHRTGHAAGEPTLGLTRDGTVFAAAFETSLRVDVLRSEDRGRSWEVVSPTVGGQNAHPFSADPYLYVDPATGRVFSIDLTIACSYLSFSDDDGETWTTNPLACGKPINDHQTLFAGPPVSSAPLAYENLVYYCWNDTLASTCSKSLDGGTTFVPTASIAFPGIHPDTGEVCGGIHGHGVVGDDGTVYLPRGYCHQPFLAISRDEGATWTRVQVAGNGVRFTDPSVDVDAQGNVYFAWIARDGLPYLAISRDGGATWTRPLMIGGPRVRETNLLTLDAGRPGGVAFAYMGTEDDDHPMTWNGYMGLTADALAHRPVFQTAVVNPAGDPLKRGACGPGRCGRVLDFIDIVVGPDGAPWASFVDACDTACARSGFEGGNEGIVGRVVGGPRLR